MTDEMMSLRALLEKSSEADLLREMVGFAAPCLMALEVESLTGAAHGERSPDRINHPNGYRDRIGGSPVRNRLAGGGGSLLRTRLEVKCPGLGN
jgi:hypothetical protein